MVGAKMSTALFNINYQNRLEKSFGSLENNLSANDDDFDYIKIHMQ